MTVFKFRVNQLDSHGHFDIFAGKNEDSLGYSGTMILRKDELKNLIRRIDAGQFEDVMSKDTPKEIRTELYS